MKILLLNPHVDAEHKLVRALEARDHAVLLAENAHEAWQMLQLHASTVDLAIIHREALSGEATGVNPDGNGGLVFVHQLKLDPVQKDLPLILSSDLWGDEQFAAHQAGPEGANAYLHWPFAADDLFGVLAALFPGTASAASLPLPPPPLDHLGGDTGSFSLEESSSIFRSMPRTSSEEPGGPDAPSIVLEAPSISSTPTSGDGSLPLPDLNPEGTSIELPPAMSALPAGSDTVSINLAQDNSSLEISSLDIEVPPAVLSVAEETPQAIVLSTEPQDLPESLGVNPDESPADLSVEAEGFSDAEADQALSAELPYLFNSGKTEATPAEAAPEPAPVNPVLAFAQPVGDAVVPGGAAQTPDLETLKRYLLLREQDVAVLSGQLRDAQAQVKALEDQLKAERGHSSDLQHKIDEQRRRIDDFESEKSLMAEGLRAEIAELKFQVRSKTDKARVMEIQVRDAAEEIERLKDRVRADIRKIRVREKELESRLEIAKKDSEALLTSRESRIIELKRKLDTLEFNLDLLQDQYAREKEASGKLREKLARAAQVIRVAGGLLDAVPGGRSAMAELAEDPDTGTETEEKTKAS